MKRVAIARLFQETSSFSPRNTTLEDFRQFGLYLGEGVFSVVQNLRDEISGFISAANELGDLELVPILWAVGWTGGPLTPETFSFLKEKLIAGLLSAGHLDGVLLALHGSMVAEDIQDTEGHILAAIRNLIGENVPLVATFDHHANMTRAIVENLNGVVAYRSCPHSDVFETGRRGAELISQILSGEVRPTIGFQKIPMITPADKFETEKEPLACWFRKARILEVCPDVVSVSLYPVQPWLDVPEYGWSVAVVTNDDRPLAERLAADLAQQAWDMRFEFLVDNPQPEEAIHTALQQDGPIVIADGSDATNGGAPGDSTILLKEMLRQKVDKKVFLTLVDPAAVEKCLATGLGKEVAVDVGGKMDPLNSSPVHVRGRVAAVSDGKFTIAGGSHHAIHVDMGRTVVLVLGTINIVVSEKLQPGHDPLVYRHIGLEPEEAQIIVVKCVVGHMKAYERIMTKTIWTDCPGPTPSNLARLRHEHVDRPLFPLDKDMTWRAVPAS